MSHTRWRLARERKLTEGYTESEDAAAERAEIRLAMAYAKAEESRLKGADTVPTLPLLRRLAAALDASLNIALDDDREEVTFVAHSAA